MNAAALKTRWSKLRQGLHLHKLPPGVRRALVAVIGSVVLLIGVAMIILPGPAIVVIPLGLAILASEFAWARRWWHASRDWLKRTGSRVWRRWSRQGEAQ